MELEYSLLYSQEPATGPYPELMKPIHILVAFILLAETLTNEFKATGCKCFTIIVILTHELLSYLHVPRIISQGVFISP
jgi:hypothetical protein